MNVMLNRIYIFILLLLMGCSQVIASDQRVTALQIKRIDEAVCKKMIEKQIMHLKLKNVNSIKDIRLDNESYEIQSGSKSFFFRFN